MLNLCVTAQRNQTYAAMFGGVCAAMFGGVCTAITQLQ